MGKHARTGRVGVREAGSCWPTSLASSRVDWEEEEAWASGSGGVRRL